MPNLPHPRLRNFFFRQVRDNINNTLWYPLDEMYRFPRHGAIKSVCFTLAVRLRGGECEFSLTERTVYGTMTVPLAGTAATNYTQAYTAMRNQCRALFPYKESYHDVETCKHCIKNIAARKRIEQILQATTTNSRGYLL